MESKKCYKCGCENGEGKKELRPYGPGGKWVCFACAFATAEDKMITGTQFRIKLGLAENQSNQVLLTENGPLPLKPEVL